MRRRRIIVGVAVLVLAAVGAVLFWPRPPHPCRDTFKQVREGMTFEEVCATVGGPPGDYSDGRSIRVHYMEEDETWLANDSHFGVSFDRRGRVTSRTAHGVVRPTVPRPPFWSRLLARLGL
jgi:hypothetical protein